MLSALQAAEGRKHWMQEARREGRKSSPARDGGSGSKVPPRPARGLPFACALLEASRPHFPPLPARVPPLARLHFLPRAGHSPPRPPLSLSLSCPSLAM